MGSLKSWLLPQALRSPVNLWLLWTETTIEDYIELSRGFSTDIKTGREYLPSAFQTLRPSEVSQRYATKKEKSSANETFLPFHTFFKYSSIEKRDLKSN